MNKLIVFGAIALVSMVAAAGTKLSFEKQMSLNGERLSGLELDVGSGSLTIVGTSGNEIKVEATIESDDYKNNDDLLKGFNERMVLSLERDSGFALLKAKQKSKLGWGKSKNIAIHLSVEVPRHFDVVVDDGSGSMVIDNIDGAVQIEDGSGSVTLTRIGNDVDIDDGSGAIHIADIAGDVYIDDASGPIEVKNISGSVHVEDGSGAILAKVISGDFKVEDGSGEIIVKDLQGEFILVDDGSGTVHVNGLKWRKK